jgi:hypothetical protein
MLDTMPETSTASAGHSPHVLSSATFGHQEAENLKHLDIERLTLGGELDKADPADNVLSTERSLIDSGECEVSEFVKVRLVK